MKILAIIQARMGSTRLPGKMLADIEGVPLIGRVLERIRRAVSLSDVIVATSNSPADDALADWCAQAGATCFRGNSDDVLDRYYQAAQQNAADVIVRVTGDCPLIDPGVTDRIVRVFLASDCDYVSNTIRYTYPDGLDTEVFSFAALETAWHEARKPSEREHVTPYIIHSGKFRIMNVEHEVDLSPLQYRWTVDDAADLAFCRALYRRFNGRYCNLQEILDLLAADPSLVALQGGGSLNEGYCRSLYQEAAGDPAAPLKLDRSAEWFTRSSRVIPGCAQTFSKGATQYVQGVSPLFLERGSGCRVTDVDGNEYIDYVQGLLPNLLGYAHPEVDAAVSKQLAQGVSFSLPHPLEVQLAEKLCALIPCAEMVRFGKNGSDATSGAIRASRALTGREHVACCGYHGWQDWYIGTTTRNRGVPEGVSSLTHPFPYNDPAALETILATYPTAAVIMEPFNFTDPDPGFLEKVKEVTHRHGALLIFDEICTGFRFGTGGAQKLFGVTPDLGCFGKAMGNGHPISCIVGRREVMKVFEEIFFSFTFAGEAVGLAAALAVIDILERSDALSRINYYGQMLRDGVRVLARESGMADRCDCIGRPPWTLLRFRTSAGKDDAVLKSLFIQESLRRGILTAGSHNISAAHDERAIHRTLEAYAAVFKTLAHWLESADPQVHLQGPVISPVFRAR